MLTSTKHKRAPRAPVAIAPASARGSAGGANDVGSHAATAPGQRHPLDLGVIDTDPVVRIRPVLDEVLDALRPIVRAADGNTPRPVSLARALSIDKTLSARVVRAVRSQNVSDVVHDIPSPEGLRIILSATKRLDLPEEALSRATRAVRAFESLISEFPGGRSGLNSTVAGWSPTVRDRTESSAKQAVHKAMTSLLGYSAEVSLATYIIQPSSQEGFCDTAYVLGKFGVRRLRPSHAITMFGRTLTGQDEKATQSPQSCRLDGSSWDGPDDFILPEYSSRPMPKLELLNTKKAMFHFLPEGVPGVNEPISMVSAQLVRRSLIRKKGVPQVEDFTPRMPSQVFVMDVMVREDTFDGPPVVATTLQSLSSETMPPGHPSFKLDEVSLQTPMEMLRLGLDEVEMHDIPNYRGLVHDVFGRLGWDRTRFRGYRVEIRYPVPQVNVGMWFGHGG